MAKKAKKTTKLKTPKTVAGVKLSKQVRKAGDAALKVAEHPAISSIVAAGLLAAAAALTEDKKLHAAAKTVEGDVDEAARTVGRAKTAAKAAMTAIGQAIADEVKVLASTRGAK